MRFIFWFNCLFFVLLQKKFNVCLFCPVETASCVICPFNLSPKDISLVHNEELRQSSFKMFWSRCFFLSWHAHSPWSYNTGFTVDGDARVAAVFSWALWWTQSTFALLTTGKLMKHVWFCSTGWNETKTTTWRLKKWNQKSKIGMLD